MTLFIYQHGTEATAPSAARVAAMLASAVSALRQRTAGSLMAIELLRTVPAGLVH
jgi:hypothetical protein